MSVAVVIQADSAVRLCDLLGTMVKKTRDGQSCGGKGRTETDMEAGLWRCSISLGTQPKECYNLNSTFSRF